MSFMENGEGTNPKWGAGTSHFFYSKNIKSRWNVYGASTEYVWSIHRGILGGQMVGKKNVQYGVLYRA